MQIAGWNPSPSARPNVREFIRAAVHDARGLCERRLLHAYSYSLRSLLRSYIRSYIRLSVRSTPPTFRGPLFNERLRDADREVPHMSAYVLRADVIAPTRGVRHSRLDK